MRFRSFATLAFAISSFAWTERAGGQSANTDGLVPGTYLRLSGGTVTPVNPQGSLKTWNAGHGFNVMWENWSTGQGGLSRFGFAFFGDLSFLPFDEQQFKTDFANGPNGAVTSASAKAARVIQFGLTTRYRIPVPYVTPSIFLGFGFIDWRPSQINYTATGGPGTAKHQNRQGGVLSIGAGLDKNIYGSVAVFGEASYGYGYTSFGQSLSGSGSACITTDCDLLKNTPLGVIRGGLRIRMKR